MFTDNFKEVLKHNGVVSITSWANDQAHVANTWNSYLQLKDDNKLLIPAAWFDKTEANTKINNQVIITLGSPEVEGKFGMGTGYAIIGSTKFIDSGDDFDMMKEKYDFMTRLIEVTITSLEQKI